MPSPPPSAAVSSDEAARTPAREEGKHEEESVSAPALAADSRVAAPSSLSSSSSSSSSSSTNEAAATDAAPPPPPSQRALTYEEFRQFYVASRRSDLAQQSRSGDPVYHPHELEQLHGEAERERRRRLAAELCEDLTALAQERHGGLRRRLHDVGDVNGHAAATAAADGSPVGVGRTPSPPTQPDVMGRIGAAVGTAASWALQQISENIIRLLQFSLLGYLVYSQSDGDGRILLVLLGIFAVFSVLRAVVHNFRIGHETGTVSAPSFLGRLFKPEGQTDPVSTPRKVGYMAAKCVESFILSVFPTYSIERLETELQVDGIVH